LLYSRAGGNQMEGSDRPFTDICRLGCCALAYHAVLIKILKSRAARMAACRCLRGIWWLSIWPGLLLDRPCPPMISIRLNQTFASLSRTSHLETIDSGGKNWKKIAFGSVALALCFASVRAVLSSPARDLCSRHAEHLGAF